MTKIAENTERGLSLAERNKIARVRIGRVMVRGFYDPGTSIVGRWIFENGRKTYSEWRGIAGWLDGRGPGRVVIFDRVR